MCRRRHSACRRALAFLELGPLLQVVLGSCPGFGGAVELLGKVGNRCGHLHSTMPIKTNNSTHEHPGAQTSAHALSSFTSDPKQRVPCQPGGLSGPDDMCDITGSSAHASCCCHTLTAGLQQIRRSGHLSAGPILCPGCNITGSPVLIKSIPSSRIQMQIPCRVSSNTASVSAEEMQRRGGCSLP